MRAAEAAEKVLSLDKQKKGVLAAAIIAAVVIVFFVVHFVGQDRPQVRDVKAEAVTMEQTLTAAGLRE